MFVAALDESVPDIVLADFSLPRFDALGALRLLRGGTPTWLVVVTGTITDEAAVA